MNSAFQKRARVLWVCLRLAPLRGITAADVASLCPELDRATIYRCLDDLTSAKFLVRDGENLFLNEEIAAAGKKYYDALLARSRDLDERLARFGEGPQAPSGVEGLQRRGDVYPETRRGAEKTGTTNEHK